MPNLETWFENRRGLLLDCAPLRPQPNHSRFRIASQWLPVEHTLILKDSEGDRARSRIRVQLTVDAVGVTDCWQVTSPHTGELWFELDFTHFLATKPWPPEERFADTLDHLAVCAGGHLDFQSFVHWVPPLIEGLYTPGRDHLAGEFTWAVKRAKLCALFLAWLDRQADRYRYQVARFGLLSLHHEALAYLYERENELPEDYRRGWHLAWAYRQGLREWHAICQDPKSRWFFDNLMHQDQAQAMLNLVAYRTRDGRCRLRRLFRETPEGRAFAFDHVARWFLSRYDVPRAERIHNALATLPPIPAGRPSQPVPDGDGYVEPNTLCRRLAWHAGLVVGGLLVIAVLLSSFGTGGFAARLAQLLVRGTTVVAYFVLVVLSTFIWRRPDYLQLALPRMVAGLFAGYAALIFVGDAWQVIHELSGAPGRWLLLVGGSFALATLGLWGRVASLDPGTPISWRDVPAWLWRNPGRRHLWLLLRRVLGLSMLGGVVVVDLLGDHYLGQSGTPPTPPILFEGFLGTMYPFLALAFAVLALFVATFVQLLWEERPLTEPWS